ncbi:hypothetical protein BGZ65_006611 [Modicella reniformis]|uniref:Uncharacterized protein n=1 Tax=Modicella reniformis TaxID=1440133 RepID=A0A9P6INB1_9FUNG|nr:hypothetical protein BGZ65_006611 [Modicella reniformis]
MRISVLAIAAAIVAPVLALEHAVWIISDGFVPQSITIKAGDTVKWTNNDKYYTHTVTPIFPKPISPGMSLSFQFNTPSIVDYYCSIHPFMEGKVIVEKV